MNTSFNFYGFIAAVEFNSQDSTIECMVSTQQGTKVLRHKVGSKTGATKAESRQLWSELQACKKDQDQVFFIRRADAKGFPTYFDSVLISPDHVLDDEVATIIA